MSDSRKPSLTKGPALRRAPAPINEPAFFDLVVTADGRNHQPSGEAESCTSAGLAPFCQDNSARTTASGQHRPLPAERLTEPGGRIDDEPGRAPDVAELLIGTDDRDGRVRTAAEVAHGCGHRH